MDFNADLPDGIRQQPPLRHHVVRFTSVLLLLTCAIRASADDNPLASWNDTGPRRVIVDFVTRVTTEGSDDFVAAAERIAVFDNDGTLWCEQPLYFQLFFALDRVKAPTENIQACPRKEFIYVNDDGQVVAMRLGPWKAVFLENRADAFQIWREPFTELRVPLLFNLRRDPFEKSQIDANVYHDWFLDHAFVLVPMQQLAGQFLQTLADYPPSQTPGSFNLEKIQEQIEDAARGR